MSFFQKFRGRHSPTNEFDSTSDDDDDDDPAHQHAERKSESTSQHMLHNLKKAAKATRALLPSARTSDKNPHDGELESRHERVPVTEAVKKVAIGSRPTVTVRTAPDADLGPAVATGSEAMMRKGKKMGMPIKGAKSAPASVSAEERAEFAAQRSEAQASAKSVAHMPAPPSKGAHVSNDTTSRTEAAQVEANSISQPESLPGNRQARANASAEAYGGAARMKSQAEATELARQFGFVNDGEPKVVVKSKTKATSLPVDVETQAKGAAELEAKPAVSTGLGRMKSKAEAEHLAKVMGLVKDGRPKGSERFPAPPPVPPATSHKKQPPPPAPEKGATAPEKGASRSPRPKRQGDFLQEPISSDGIRWLCEESLVVQKAAAIIKAIVPKFRMSRSDNEYAISILHDKAKSDVHKLEEILKLGASSYPQNATNGSLVDALDEADLRKTKVRYRGYVGGDFYASISTPQTDGANPNIKAIPVNQRKGDICGLKQRELNKLCELLNPLTNPDKPKNWRNLARALHEDYRPVPDSFSKAKNPTLELLLHWNKHYGGDKATLHEKLLLIKRSDCATVIPMPRLASLTGVSAVGKSEGQLMVSQLSPSVIAELSTVLYRKSRYHNWFALGLCLRIPHAKILSFEKLGSRAPRKLLDLLAGREESKKVACSVLELYRGLLAINRPDIATFLDELIPEESLEALKVDPCTPEVILQPSPAQIPAGSSATLECLGCGIPSIRYQWLCNGSPKAGATQDCFATHTPGEYSCRISNDLASVHTRVVTVSHMAPEEIKSQGAQAVQTYTVALEEGSICTNRVRVMVIGQDRTGKSSLIRSLLKKAFSRSDSTIGIDIKTATFPISPGVFNGSGKDVCVFVEDANGGAGFCEGEFARAVAHHLHSQQQRHQLQVTESQDNASIASDDTTSTKSYRTESVTSVASVTASLVSTVSSDAVFSANTPTSCADAESAYGSVGTGDMDPDGALAGTPAGPQVPSADDNEGERRATASLTKADAIDGDEHDKMARTESVDVTPDLQQKVMKLLEDLDAQVHSASEHVLVRIYDFAGQPVYYNTHSVFMSDTGIYLLVHNMSRELEGEAQVHFSEDGHERVVDQDQFLSTNLDYLYGWMSAVYTATGNVEAMRKAAGQAAPSASLEPNESDTAGSKKYIDPPVLVVGTHRDQVAENGHHELAKAIITKSQDLDRYLGGKAYGAHLSHPFFFVDNSVSGSGAEDPEVGLLRQSIRAHAVGQPGTRHRVPIKWLKCELLIEKLVQVEHMKHMKFEDFKGVAAKVGIQDEDTLKTMLAFYSGLGVLVYFGDSLRLADLVILDPQWLADVFKQLITVPPADELDPQQAEWWKCVTKTGLLHPDLVKHIWSEKKVMQQRSKLLAIMAKFDLVCPFRTSYRVHRDSGTQGELAQPMSLEDAARLEYDEPETGPTAVSSRRLAAEAAVASAQAASVVETTAQSTEVSPSVLRRVSSIASASNRWADAATAAVSPTICYMVPSLLRAAPPAGAFHAPGRNDPAPICLVSAIGFLPEAFFYRLVARCVARFSVCPDLYRRFARLHMDKKFDLLIFFKSFWVEFVVQPAEGGNDAADVADQKEHLKTMCSRLIRSILRDAAEVRRQGMRGLVFSLATCVLQPSGEEQLAYITNVVCGQHTRPLPACAEYGCKGCTVPRSTDRTEETCVKLPAKLTVVQQDDGKPIGAASGTLALPFGLELWFPSTAILPLPDPSSSVNFDESFSCPIIGQQPRDTSVRKGGVLELHCFAKGRPEPHYQWRRGGQDLKQQTKSTLRIPDYKMSAHSKHAVSMYSCLVQNDAGYLFSRTAVVNCLPAGFPFIAQHPPATVEKNYHDEIMLEVLADGESLSYQWFFFDRPIAGETGSLLHIRRIHDWDEGQYQCLVGNKYGEVTSDVCNLYLSGKENFEMTGKERKRAQRIAEESETNEKGVVVASAKVALLIGNRDYKRHHKLIHPESDVIAVGRALEDHGFRTFVYVNLTLREMTVAVKRFVQMLSKGVYALFYYAGHGLEDVTKDNYLVPIDMDTSTNLRKCIRLHAIHYEMQKKNPRLITMVMDCCRTDVKSSTKQVPRCKIPLERFANYAYHFSCASSTAALESKSDKNSVYAMAFLKELSSTNKSNSRVEEFFSRVGTGVKNIDASDHKSGRAAVRPELTSFLASARNLKWTDDIDMSQRNKFYHKMMQKHVDFHQVPGDVDLACTSEDLVTTVRLSFYRRVANILLVSSLVDKSERESMQTQFDLKALNEQGISAVLLSNASPLFLKNLARLCCPSHTTVLFLLDVQQLKSDVRLRLRVRSAARASAHLHYVLERSVLGPLCKP